MCELRNEEVQRSENYLKLVLQQEAGAFGNNIGEDLQKPPSKMKNMYIIYLLRKFILPTMRCKWYFLPNMYKFCRTTTQVFSL